MSIIQSYVPREWNDDDRYNDYISYHYDDTPQHVPVYKILKEMYDEDKARLYQYDLEEEYLYKYGELLYDEVYTNGFYEELYSDYYDIYSETSGIMSDTDVIEDTDVEDYRQESTEKTKEDTTVVVVGEDDVVGEDKEPYQSKFIYL
jgi:hypothetical protein